MFKRLTKGLIHTATILNALPSAPRRALLRRMIGFSQALPQQFNQPLPVMMRQLTPHPAGSPPTDTTSDEIRRLADAVAAWHFRSPLGICLRRSLLRYYFLHQAGVPVQIIFGARKKSSQEGDGIGGHAWLTLNGNPFYEDPQDYSGFVPMYLYPPEVANQ